MLNAHSTTKITFQIEYHKTRIRYLTGFSQWTVDIRSWFKKFKKLWLSEVIMFILYLNLLVPIYFRILQESSNQSQTGMLLESARLSMPGARNWCTDIGMQMKYRYRTMWSSRYLRYYILYLLCFTYQTPKYVWNAMLKYYNLYVSYSRNYKNIVLNFL